MVNVTPIEAAAEETTGAAAASAPPAPLPVATIFPPAGKPNLPTIRQFATEEDATRAAELPKLTVEQWAERKGFSPERQPSAPAPAGNIPLGSPMNPKFWMFAGARALSRWPQGAEVTEAEFDAAIEQATTGISR